MPNGYLPSDTHTVQLRGRYVDPQGLPLAGTVSFTPPPTVVLKDSNLMVGRTTTVTLDEEGSFVVWLVATDSPNMSPVGWAYQVTEQLTAPTPQVPPFVPAPPPTRTFYILLPSGSGPVDLADLAPAQPYTVSYLPVTGPTGPPGLPGPMGLTGPPGPVARVVTLTDAATISMDASAGTHFRVTLGGNRTLGVPSNPVDGQRIVLEVVQDSTGSRTLAFASGAGGFAFGTDLTGVTLTMAPGKRDLVGCVYSGSAARWLVNSLSRGF